MIAFEVQESVFEIASIFDGYEKQCTGLVAAQTSQCEKASPKVDQPSEALKLQVAMAKQCSAGWGSAY